MNLVVGDTEVLGQARVAGVHPCAGLGRRRIRVVGLNLEAPVVLAQAVEHRCADIGSAGVLEEGLSAQTVLGECREPGADIVQIQGRGRGRSPPSL